MERFLLEHIRVGLVLTLFTPLLVGRFGFSFGEYPKALFFGVLMEILLAAWLFLVFQNRTYLPKNTKLLWLVAGFMGISFLSGVFGFNFERSLWGDMERSESLALYLHFFAFFLILSGVVKTQKDWTVMFRWTAGISLLASIAAFLQVLGVYHFYALSAQQEGISPILEVSGTFTNSLFFASYLVIAIFLALFLFIRESRWQWKAFSVVVLCADLVALFLAASRGAWLGAGIGIGLFCCVRGFFWLSEKPHWRRRAAMGAGLAAITLFAVLALVLWQAVLDTDNFYIHRAVSFMDSLTTRLEVWRVGLEVWKERPLLGWGHESFSYTFELRRESSFEPGAFFDRPHSKPVELLHNSGLAGFSAYMAIFALVWYRLMRPARPLLSLSARLALAALFLAYFAQNVFIFDTVSTYLLFFFLLAFLNNTVMPQSRFAIRIPRLPRGIVFSAFVATTGGILVLFYMFHFQPLQLNLLMVRGTSFEPEDVGQALSYYQNIFEKKGLYADDFKVFITERTLSYFDADWARRGRSHMISLFSQAQPVLEEKLKNPDKVHRNYYALLLGISEKRYDAFGLERFLKEAEKTASEALVAYPNNARFHRALGQIYILEGEYEKGEEYMERSFALTTHEFPEWHQISFFQSLGGAYFRAGNKQKAAENFKKAVDIDYTWAKTSSAPIEGSYLAPAFADEVARFHFVELNDVEAAKEIYEHAIEVYPQRQREWFQLQYESLLKACCG